MKNLSLTLLACLLAGCVDSTFAEPRVPHCEDPQVLPDRALTDQDIEILWGRDRTALRVCGSRVAASNVPI